MTRPAKPRRRAPSERGDEDAERFNRAIETLVDELSAERRRVRSTDDNAARRRAELRARILHAALVLLQRRDDEQVELTAAAANAVLKRLGVDDMYGSGDRRGRRAAKEALLKAMAEAVVQQVAEAAHAPPRTKTQELKNALAFAGTALRAEPDSTAALPPTSSSPYSVRVAYYLYLSALSGDDAVIAVFGELDDPDESIVDKMARALRAYARGLDQHRSPEVAALCAYALWGAGLLNVQERSEFFGR